MDIPTVLDLSTERARGVLDGLMAPALMPLPHIPVSAELWEGDGTCACTARDLRRAPRIGSWWMIVVQESNTLSAGCVRLTPLSEIRCESASGRRGG